MVYLANFQGGAADRVGIRMRSPSSAAALITPGKPPLDAKLISRLI